MASWGRCSRLHVAGPCHAALVRHAARATMEEQPQHGATLDAALAHSWDLLDFIWQPDSLVRRPRRGGAARGSARGV